MREKRMINELLTKRGINCYPAVYWYKIRDFKALTCVMYKSCSQRRNHGAERSQQKRKQKTAGYRPFASGLSK